MRRRGRPGKRPLAALTFGLVAAVAAALASAGGAAAGVARCEYEDDDPARAKYALDIEKVEVRRRAGALRFRVEFAKEIALEDGDGIQISVDSVPDAGEDGDDYYFDFIRGYEFGAPTFSVWEDGDWSEVEPPPVRFSLRGRDATFRIAARDIGNPERFGFWVVAETDFDPDGEGGDYSPEHEVWGFPSCRKTGAPEPRAGERDDGEWFPLVPVAVVAGAVFALGALVAIAGWSYERIRARGAQ